MEGGRKKESEAAQIRLILISIGVERLDMDVVIMIISRHHVYGPTPDVSPF